MILKKRSTNTAKSIKLLEQSSWQTIFQNVCLFDQIGKIIGDIIPELTQEELDDVQNAKIVEFQNSFDVNLIQEVQNLIENVIEIESKNEKK